MLGVLNFNLLDRGKKKSKREVLYYLDLLEECFIIG